MAETVRIEIPIETVDETEPELSNVIKKIGKLGDEADKTGQKTKKNSEYISEFDRRAKKTEQSLLKWAKEKYEIMLEAKDRISPVLSTIKHGLGSFAGKTWSVTMRAVDFLTSPIRGIIGLLGNPIFQAGAVLGVSIGLTDAINTYKDFEAAMSQVRAVSGATESEVAKLTDKAKEMGATTKFTAEEAAEAFNYMAMAGWKTGDMMDGIEGILNLAAASGESLAATSDIVTDALTAFGMKASDSGHFADVLAQASASANTNVGMLGESFKYVAPVAGALKYSVEDVSLALGLMANSSIKGSMAGTSLKTSLANMASPTDKMATAMKRYNISLTDSKGEMKTLKGVLDNLRNGLGGLAEAEQTAAASAIFGKEAMAGMLSIINASEEDYGKLGEAIRNSDGAAARMSETMLDNLQGSLTLLQSAVDGVKISFGGRMSHYVRGFADFLVDQMPAIEQGLDKLMDWVDGKVSQAQKKFSEVSSREDWQKGDFFGKAQIAWNEFIIEPFSEWWSTTGKAKFAGFAQEIGSGIGTGLKLGIMTLLGIDIGGALDEGVSIGASFAKGFSEGFDFKAVTEKLWQGFGNLFSNAGKLLPGGEEADLSSVLSAIMLGKIASPFISMGKGAASIGKGLFGANPATGISLMGSFLGSAASGTGLLGKSGTLAINLGAGNLAGGASMGAGALSATGMAAGAGAIAAGATLVSSALDAYKAIKSDNAEESKAYGKSAGWKAGGVVAGAAIGSFIPGLGTAAGALIGAGVGGIAGWIKGNKIKEEYQQNMEEMQKEAEKAQKVFEATGFSIDDVNFETKALNDAINDTRVSTQELGAMFQGAVTDKLNSRFGDLKLSLKEIKEAASNLVFDKYTESIHTFSSAVAKSESALSTFRSRAQTLDKLNWKVGLSLGLELSEDDIEEYWTAVDEFAENAKTYVKDKQYEATVALQMFFGEDGEDYTSGLNTMYADLQSQIDSLSGQLTAELDIALKDGVITLDEKTEIINIQKQITGITDKLAQAEADAQFEAIKIRYGGAELDAESFAGLQKELQANVESMTQSYNEALVVSLTNLKLQLSEGVIDKKEYNAQLQEITDGYQAQIDELQVRVESFQLEAIAEAFDSELDGILPNIQGTTAEKLTKVMNNALAIEPEPVNWADKDIAKWFGLENLSAETQGALSEVLRMTAETIPKRMTDAMIDAMTQADYGGTGLAVANGVGTAISKANMEEINAGINTLYSKTGAQIDATFANTFTTSADVNVNLNWRVTNPTADIDISAGGGGAKVSAKISKNAAGGYVSGGPQLSWLAEEGYGEFVIPTNPSRRSRALDLYEQAGAALGVSAHAAGGYVGGSILSDTALDYNFFSGVNRNASLVYNETIAGNYDGEMAQTYEPVLAERESSFGGASVQVSVSVAPEFVIHGNNGQNEETIMQVIRRHMKEMADELGGEIAGRLEEVFSNMPLKEA